MEKTSNTTISQLPDELINHILSFLPITIASRTILVSKRWKSIRDTNTTSVVLCWYDFCKSSYRLKRFFRKSNPLKLELLNSVSNFLHMRVTNKVNVQRFEISVIANSLFEIHMNTWVKLLICCNIKELDVYNCKIWHDNDDPCSFPQAIFSASSLTRLKLIGFKLDCKGFPDIKLASLKDLSLRFMVISNESIEQIIKSCIALEDLHLIRCEGFSSLKVSGLLGLKRLKVSFTDLEWLEIDEPNLVDLVCEGYFTGCHHINFGNFRALKKLFLRHVDITSDWLSEQLMVLSYLEDLEFMCCNVSSLNISSDRLKKLNIGQYDKELQKAFNYNKEFSEVNINTPNLEFFSFTGVGEKLPTFSLNVPPTMEVELEFVPPMFGSAWFIDLLNILSFFDLTRLTLTTNLPNLIIPQEWKKRFSHTESLAQFQTLWVDSEAHLVDLLRSVCPRVKSSLPRVKKAKIDKGRSRVIKLLGDWLGLSPRVFFYCLIISSLFYFLFVFIFVKSLLLKK